MDSALQSTSFKGVLFDLDGTLIDTAPDFIVCLNQLRAEHQLAPLPFHNIRKVVSDGARAMVSLGFNIQEGEMGFEEKRQRFLDLYANNIAAESRLFEGLESTLAYCKSHNIPWGIVTNKPRRFSELLLTELNLLNELDSLVCADDVAKPKPNKEPMIKACQELNLAAEDYLYVGDHARDIQAGKNANMPTIAAAYGYVHDENEALEWQADWTVHSGQELHDLLVTLLRTS